MVLFDSGAYKLARRRKLDYTEIRDRAQKYFDDKFGRALSFLVDVPHPAERSDYKQASFYLHQAAENLLRVIPMVFILYGHKSHNLSELMNAVKNIRQKYSKYSRAIRRRRNACSIYCKGPT